MKSTVKRARERERERERERIKIKSAEKSPEIKGLRKTQRVKEDYLSETWTTPQHVILNLEKQRAEHNQNTEDT